MPLTPKGKKIMKSMEKTYGKKKKPRKFFMLQKIKEP